MNTRFKKAIAALVAASLAAPSVAAIPTSTYAYDFAGRLTQVTEGNGQLHEYTPFAWDIPLKYRQPHPSSAGVTQGEVTFGYGRVGKLVKVIDPRGLQTSYTLNGLLAKTSSVTSPDTGQTTYSYDVAGNLKTVVSPAGDSFTFSYDALNRPVSASYGDTSTAWAYYDVGAGAGEMASMVDSSGSTAWAYDAFGHVTSKSQVTSGPAGGNGAQLVLTQSWDAERLLQVQYPSGNVVSFTYDAENVASIVVNGVTVISNITHQAFGPVTGWTMAGVGVYTRAFDTAGRVTSHTYEGGQRSLSWDASNRLTQIQNPDGSTWSYSYDNLNRTVSSQEGYQGSRSYDFDAVGNRTIAGFAGTSHGYAVDATSNKLATSTGPEGARSYQYGVGGRIIGDGTRTFAWTKAGQLAGATNGTVSATYTYNGFGQRVKKVVAGAARHYLYADDGVSLLGEYAQGSSGAPITTVNEIVYLDGLPVLVLRGSAVYFIKPDHLGTPRLIRNTAGAPVWRWNSDAFGTGTPDQNPSGVFFFEFNSRLPGQQFDAETGLFYNNARYYDPQTGRYISSDPIGLAGGINTYGYAYQSPLANADPSGELVPAVLMLVARAAFAAWTAHDLYQGAKAVVSPECGQSRWLAGASLAAAAIPLGKVARIGGRLPVNWKYAGKVFRLEGDLATKYPKGVQFTVDGLADFSPYAVAKVKVPGLTGANPADARAAERLLGATKPAGTTWHHHFDGETMMAVPTDLHNAVRHTGGGAIIRNGS